MEAEGKGVELFHWFDTRGYLLQSYLRHLLPQAVAGRGKDSALAGTERTATAGITATTADLAISEMARAIAGWGIAIAAVAGKAGAAADAAVAVTETAAGFIAVAAAGAPFHRGD